jgi:hypothetical protein
MGTYPIVTERLPKRANANGDMEHSPYFIVISIMRRHTEPKSQGLKKCNAWAKYAYK